MYPATVDCKKNLCGTLFATAREGVATSRTAKNTAGCLEKLQDLLTRPREALNKLLTSVSSRAVYFYLDFLRAVYLARS